MKFKFNNGGSKFKLRDDCVIRAIAIATEQDYTKVLNDFKKLMDKAPYKGVPKKITRKYLKDIGWRWIPTMSIGQGCKIHLKENELPSGRIICKVTKHITAVIDGVINDTYDCSRNETRCVYGYWVKNLKLGYRNI